MKMNVVVKTLQVEDQEFVIVKQDGHFCSINKKDIDEKGCLKRTLNGLQMNASKDLNQCVMTTIGSVKIQKMIAGGMSAEDATMKYFREQMAQLAQNA